MWKAYAFSEAPPYISAELVHTPKNSITHLAAFAHLATILGNVLTNVYAVKRKKTYKEDFDGGLLQDMSSRLQQWHCHLQPQFRWGPGQRNVMMPHTWVALVRLCSG